MSNLAYDNTSIIKLNLPENVKYWITLIIISHAPLNILINNKNKIKYFCKTRLQEVRGVRDLR